ncbi:MAG: chorismate synthase, partial [Erysipelotrichaceae bacterium]|nr:chorismate synthase [Erysipelotrichaceae bacterium]
MRNTFGNHISVTIFGESHGEAVGCVIDGICAGTEYDEEFLLAQLDKRKPKGTISTARKESDIPHILSGVYHGKFTGTPVTIVFENSNQHSADYEKTAGIARPSHADYV